MTKIFSKALHLRLFLEGVEVPVISASVSSTPDASAVCSVQIPAVDIAVPFVELTMGHLFTLEDDDLQKSVDNSEVYAPADGEGGELAGASKLLNFNSRNVSAAYKSAFQGVLLGYNLSKTESSRALVLQFADFSHFWDKCVQWFADYGPGGDGFSDRVHKFYGARAYTFDSVAGGTTWVMGNLIARGSRNPAYADLKGLHSGVLGLYETVGGVGPLYSSNGVGFTGTSPFFTIAELRYRLSAQIGAPANDRSTVQLFDFTRFRDWLKKGMEKLSTYSTFRDTVNLLSSYVYLHTYPNPAPFYVPPGTKTVERDQKTVTETSNAGPFFSKLQEAIDTVTPVRTRLNDPNSAAVAILANNTRDELTRAVGLFKEARDLVSGTPDLDVQGTLTKLQIATDRLQTAISRFPVVKSDGSFAMSFTQAQAIALIITEVLLLVEDLKRNSASKSTKRVRQTVSFPGALYTQLVLPEVFFAAPPQCNVFFPGMYGSLNYSVNFAQQTSRLALLGGTTFTTTTTGKSLESIYYLAPMAYATHGDLARKTVFGDHRTLMNHEIFSGIVPHEEWITEGQRHAFRTTIRSDSVTTGKGVNYLQRLANMQFFLQRWKSRSMSLTGPYNPFPVLGLPALVIDRVVSRVDVTTAGVEIAQDRPPWAQTYASNVLPSAYLGKIVSIDHSISQAGGSSSFAFRYVRTHRAADDEYLGSIRKSQQSLLQRTVVTVELLPAERSPTASEAEIEVLKKYFGGEGLHPGSRVSLGGESKLVRFVKVSDEMINYTEAELLNRFGLDETAASFAVTNGQVNEAGQPVASIPREFLFSLEERKTNVAKADENFGVPSDLLRPAWISDIWRNDQVTKNVYGPLLGSASITDKFTAGDAEFKGILEKFSKSSPNIKIVQSGDSAVVYVGSSALLVFRSEGEPEVESAVEGLLFLFGSLERDGIDVSDAQYQYVKRPIATLEDILGTDRYIFSRSGTIVRELSSGEELRVEAQDTPFHAQAFGTYNSGLRFIDPATGGPEIPVAGPDALAGLLSDEQLTNLAKANNLSVAELTKLVIPRHADPRGVAQSRVRIYLERFERNPAMLG